MKKVSLLSFGILMLLSVFFVAPTNSFAIDSEPILKSNPKAIDSEPILDMKTNPKGIDSEPILDMKTNPKGIDSEPILKSAKSDKQKMMKKKEDAKKS